MNAPIAIAFGLICLALLAHLSGGLKESLTVRPANANPDAPDYAQMVGTQRNWVQLMCAFQLLSVDLGVIAVLLYLLAFTTVLAPIPGAAWGMAVWFAAWGIAWFLQIAFLGRPKKDYLFLGHWGFWFVCSGLLIWGALQTP